jgi:hypothetical protein
MPYRVFIISSRKDLELAKELAQKLEKIGVRVYSVERNAVAGDNIITGINPDLSRADEVLLVVTQNSVDSQGLASLMGIAHSLQKFVTPIIKGLKRDELPPIIRHMEYVKYDELSKYISNLKKRVSEQQASEKQAKAS